MSTRRNVNLNRELPNDWVGRVRKWEKRWVVCEDKSSSQQPAATRNPLRLLKWVQTEARVNPQAPARHPNIVPVTDLSLVPGARLGTPVDAADTAGQVADPLAAPPIQMDLTQPEATPSAATPAAAAGSQQQQQQQEQQQQPLSLNVPTAGSGLPPIAPPAAAAAAAGLDTPSSLVIDLGHSTSSAAAAAAAGALTDGALGSAGLALPSPSVVTGGVSFDLPLDFSAAPSVSYQRGTLDSTPAAVTASDYTVGTDSEALGRLPHGGASASDYTGGADSMDVDQTGATGGVDEDDEDDEAQNDEESDQGLGDEDDEEQGDERDEGQGMDDNEDDDDDDDDMPS